MKRPKLLEVVALTRDIDRFGLRKGHIGTVVELFEPDAVMVEFMDKDGYTVALLDLSDSDVRGATTGDLKKREYPESLPPGVEPPIADATMKASR